MAKKYKAEKGDNVFSRIKGCISDFFYGISVKMHNKKPNGNKCKVTQSSVRKKELIFYFSIVLLPLIQYFIFYICINFNSVLLAFKQYKVVGGKQSWEYAGFDNFARFIKDFFNGGDLTILAKNSLIVYAFGLLITTPFSLVFSFYIYKKYLFSEFFRVLLYLPSIISSVVTVFMLLHNFMDVSKIDIHARKKCMNWASSYTLLLFLLFLA